MALAGRYIGPGSGFPLNKGSAQIDVKISFKGRQPNKENAAKPFCRYVSPGHGPAYEKERHYVTHPVDEMVSTARKLACLIYHLLKYKQPYQEPDPVTYQLRLKKSALTKLQRQAIALGYTLLPATPPPA
jgi:hypothetical protein